MKNKSISEILTLLYSNDLENEYKAFTYVHEGKASLFFHYIFTKFEKFVEIVKMADEKELIETIHQFNGTFNIGFKNSISKQRFVNLLRRICKELLTVLKECYAANQSKALIDLEELLGTKAVETKNSMFGKYLHEQYINYCMTEIESSKVLYRVRDCNNNELRDNCWHTPYNIRQYAYAGRFSTPGFPCLYLSDSPETSMEEVGECKKKYRLIGTFTLKKGKIFSCIDLRFPLGKEEIKNTTEQEKIKLFLSYPLRLLCACPTGERKSDAFAEEYLFSQVLINVIMTPNNENSGMLSVDGVCYNSTKHVGGINYALPARTKSIPPKQDEKFSKQLEDLFDHPKPQEIKM